MIGGPYGPKKVREFPFFRICMLLFDGGEMSARRSPSNSRGRNFTETQLCVLSFLVADLLSFPLPFSPRVFFAIRGITSMCWRLKFGNLPRSLLTAYSR